MLTVLIVDDEYYAREGIKQMIKSYGNNEYYVIGEADNSFTALEIINKEQPDIVLTDIQMPIMNGIELAREAMNCSSKFIIITGHNQFEYAKQAVKLDVVDFILKPIDPEELIDAMKSATSHLIRDVDAVKKQIISFLRQENMGAGVMRQIPWGQMRLALIQMDDPQKRSVSGLIEASLAAYTQERYSILHMHTDRILVLLNAGEQHEEFLKTLQADVKREHGIILTIALSHPCSAENAPLEYLRVKEFLIDRFYQGEENLIKRLLPPGETTVLGQIENMLNAIKRSVKAGDQSKAKEKTIALYQFFLSRKCGFEIIMESAMNLYLFMRDTLKTENVPFQTLEAYNPVNHSATIQRMRDSSLALIRQGIISMRDERSESEDNAVKKAISFINSRYCENLSLELISSEVFLNQSYLSRKLKEQLGMNYSKYLIGLRMDKAIDLLRKGENVEQVANQVGYSNYRHFSNIFKQYTGYLPSKYKKY